MDPQVDHGAFNVHFPELEIETLDISGRWIDRSTRPRLVHQTLTVHSNSRVRGRNLGTTPDELAEDFLYSGLVESAGRNNVGRDDFTHAV